ncbi:hypothetical protein [Deinococcus sp. 23YEL01]|uniref:hypothetical protein n=1 Tax=Deinococcus sp. 23YEL01 TaxID=2745871 RepID=UPI001E2D6D0F|nr:hypothetical protein [Deinococcus sp. 23YEL01]MCD0168021.1 hypothetical protein [Deinococcus sp. 23YEL01]
MKIIGIDPGLHESHAASITLAPGATVYGRKANLTGTTAGNPAALVKWAAAQRSHVVLIEVARGAVAAKRDNDPVLHINIIAGQLLGQLQAAGIPAATVASGGNATAWNWRATIGVKGTIGAAGKDDLIHQIVRQRLTNPDAVPAGPKGGHLTHYWDALGVALAGLDRALSLPNMAPLAAMQHTTTLEAHALTARRTRKQACKQARTARNA